VHLKGTQLDIGTHTVTLRWINPNGTELWNSTGELNVGAPPPGITEMDLPLIAQIDLPIDIAGGYVMAIGLDTAHTADVSLQVRTPLKVAPQTMVS
jgi:hypothetical protein